MSNDVAVLRVRKNRPGVGRKLARHFNAQEVVCFSHPTHKLRDGTRILNYGRSDVPVWYADALSRGCRFVNHPHACALSVNKVATFKALNGAGVPTLEWTSDRRWAQEWSATGHAVVIRHTATGRKGNGIELLPAYNEVPHAPLYTKHYEKTHEYRVFVVGGKPVFLVQKKAKSDERLENEGQELDMLVRNHNRGWFFSIRNLTCDIGTGRKELEKLGVDATAAVGLDFSAIDILAKHDDHGRLLDAVVCETNSAPGLTGKTTWEKVTKALEEFMA